MKWERRYSYLVLSGITVLIAALALLYLAREVYYNHQHICSVVESESGSPVSPPADPAKDPGLEREYQLYLKFEKLAKKLNCETGAQL